MFPTGIARTDDEQVSPQLDRELVGLFVAGVAGGGPRLSHTHPAVFEAGQPQAELPAGWEQRADRKTTRVFFVNHNLRTTSWTDPRSKDAATLSVEGGESSDDDDEDDEDEDDGGDEFYGFGGGIRADQVGVDVDVIGVDGGGSGGDDGGESDSGDIGGGGGGGGDDSDGGVNDDAGGDGDVESSSYMDAEGDSTSMDNREHGVQQPLFGGEAQSDVVGGGGAVELSDRRRQRTGEVSLEQACRSGGTETPALAGGGVRAGRSRAAGGG